MTNASETEILAKLQSLYEDLKANYPGGISNTSTKKFTKMKAYLVQELGVPEEDVYFTGAGTRVANLEVRLSQGVQATKRTAIGVCVFLAKPGQFSDTVESGMNTCEKFMGRGKANYEAILFIGDEGGRLRFGGVLVQQASVSSQLLKDRLPNVRQHEVVPVASGEPAPLAVRVPAATGSSDPIGSLEPESLAFIQEVAKSALDCHNVILQGPPGTGKTFLARSVAEVIIASSPSGKGDFQEIQFHQAYSYEDFVQGFRPMPGGGYRLQSGAFIELCETASESPDHNFVMLIDEFNRGNVSQILGELMSLIETDKRDPAFAKRLLYSAPDEDFFYVPANVYLLGMMNTADRSLAIVDFALRRRFRFFDVEPRFGEEYVRLAVRRGIPDDFARAVGAKCERLNARIASDRRFLGPGHCIGHAYFLPSRVPTDVPDWFRSVVRTQIEPLLSEYWHDRPEVASEELGALLA